MVTAQKRIMRLLMLWSIIEFSDYGATIVSQLSLCFLHGRSIWNLPSSSKPLLL